ncbi:MAG: DUF4349 domain-containing protein [Ruminococcaceae bacterium]|nr:DUF4349 domain-containing protein [Oscillospiraceae bacterium]
MKKITAIICVVVVLFVGLCAVVGGVKNKNSYQKMELYGEKALGIGMGSNQVMDNAESSTPKEGEQNISSGSLRSYDSMIIKTMGLTVETKKYDDFLKAVNKRIKELGGYVERSNEWAYESENRHYEMTIRIPAEKLDAFLNTVEGNATVISKSTDSTNVALTYIDTESRIKALRTEQETLLSLLAKARNLDEILTIQDRLTTVRADLESYEKILKTLDNDIDYATVSLDVTEVKRESSTGTGFFTEIKEGFLDTIYNIGEGAKEIFKAFIINLPYIVIIAIVVAILYVIMKKIKKMRGKNNASGQGNN